jgi:hypothetical protein
VHVESKLVQEDDCCFSNLEACPHPAELRLSLLLLPLQSSQFDKDWKRELDDLNSHLISLHMQVLRVESIEGLNIRQEIVQILPHNPLSPLLLPKTPLLR